MRLYYTDHFDLPLPAGHRFPMSKYRRVRQRVAQSSLHHDDVLLVPMAATDEQLSVAHDADYIQRVCTGTLSEAEIRRIGFPWSPAMVQRSRRSTGATIAASLAAREDGVAANLAGGTHHAFANAGEGYCVFNDAAVAIRWLLHQSLIRRACVIDCDVHQGNGTASILQTDPRVFTFSIHGAKNFPSRKVASDLDIGVVDGIEDAPYLELLENGLEQVWQAGPYDLAIYLAGADPFEGDRLGRLRITKDGLRRRDEMVLMSCRDRHIPVAIAMAGGYAHEIEDIVDIHCQTLAVAKSLFA
ncbi:MAG: histone deacetylase [Pirellulaceae bacterium]